MNKFLLSAFACATTISSQAQDITVVKQSDNRLFATIPASITAANKAMFILGSDTEKEPRNDIEYQIMDSSFGELKSITIPVIKGYRITNGVKEENEYGDALICHTPYYEVRTGVYGDQEGGALFFSQTLFNEDDKLEYIRPNYVIERNTDSYSYVMAGFSIMQEDGTVLASISATNGRTIKFEPIVVRSYDAVYIIINEYEEYRNEMGYWQYNEFTNIYKWDGKNGSGVSKVREMRGMKAFPNPVNRNENVTVDIPEDVKDGTLLVTNASGVTLQSIKLNGQRQASVSTAQMNKGVYNIAVVGVDKPLQTSRIIVK